MMKLDINSFPVDAHLHSIFEELRNSSKLLIRAETGAGKTTRLPPFLALKRPGKVLVLEPRRLAAKLSAERCADLLKSEIGDLVGYHIRFDKKVSDSSKLIFITEGLFISYLRQDPELCEIDTVVIDEFHERNIHTDAALALCKRLQETTRPDLKLIVMSATLNTDSLEKYLGDAKVYNITGRAHPVEITHRPSPKAGRDSWEDQASKSIQEILRDKRNPLNTLVFLPGVGEIKSLERKLKSSLEKNIDMKDIEVCPLYSSLPKELQERAFKGDKRKVILSTNIAETSLTIPNVTGVVDLGLERRASFAPWSGMPLLELKGVSQASATQRAGRAGRTRPGIVYRLYSEADFYQREPFTPPEIKRVELSHYSLDLMSLGHSLDSLDWLEAPEPRNLDAAQSLLETLGAIKGHALTDLGAFLARTPLHPRLGAILYQQTERKDLILAVSVLNEAGVLSKSAQFTPEDQGTCDLTLQINLLKDFLLNLSFEFSEYHKSFIDRKKATRAKELYLSLAKKYGVKGPLKFDPTDSSLIRESLLRGFPDRVAMKRVTTKGRRKLLSYNFCMGRGGTLRQKSCLSSTSPPFVVVLEALEDPKANAAIGTSIRMASRIDREQLLEANSSLISKDSETSFDQKKGLIKIKKVTSYGKLILEEKELPPIEPKGEALSELMKENWPWPFKDDNKLREYNERVKILNKAGIEHNCPLFEDEMLELFIDSLAIENSFQQLEKIDLYQCILDQLSAQDLYVLENEAPLEIKLQNKKTFKILYTDLGPQISGRIQDFYSVVQHPFIAGATPLRIELLSPANRPAQMTTDLPGFWESSWGQVKKELRSRYPKHYWPEDPKSAEPMRVKTRVKRRE